MIKNVFFTAQWEFILNKYNLRNIFVENIIKQFGNSAQQHVNCLCNTVQTWAQFVDCAFEHGKDVEMWNLIGNMPLDEYLLKREQQN